MNCLRIISKLGKEIGYEEAEQEFIRVCGGTIGRHANDAFETSIDWLYEQGFVRNRLMTGKGYVIQILPQEMLRYENPSNISVETKWKKQQKRFLHLLQDLQRFGSNLGNGQEFIARELKRLLSKWIPLLFDVSDVKGKVAKKMRHADILSKSRAHADKLKREFVRLHGKDELLNEVHFFNMLVLLAAWPAAYRDLRSLIRDRTDELRMEQHVPTLARLPCVRIDGDISTNQSVCRMMTSARNDQDDRLLHGVPPADVPDDSVEEESDWDEEDDTSDDAPPRGRHCLECKQQDGAERDDRDRDRSAEFAGGMQLVDGQVHEQGPGHRRQEQQGDENVPQRAH